MPQVQPSGCRSSDPWARKRGHRPRCSCKIEYTLVCRGSKALKRQDWRGFEKPQNGITLFCRVEPPLSAEETPPFISEGHTKASSFVIYLEICTEGRLRAPGEC